MNFKPNMLFLNRSFDKKRLKALLLWFRLNLSENAALKAVEILQGLGFHSATQGAISLGLDDLKTPKSKGGRVFQAQVEVALAHHEHHRGNRTPVELFQHLVDTWHRTSQDLTTEVVQLFHSTERVNPVYMMAFSGARGNISQVRQLVGMRGLMADPRGQIVGFPILSNFREGLTITEYFVSCYGARKGVVDTAIRTADAGYLTRRLADVSHHVVVRTTNCGTHESILLRDIKEGQKTILSLANRLVGRVLAEHVSLPVDKASPAPGFAPEAQQRYSEILKHAIPQGGKQPNQKRIPNSIPLRYPSKIITGIAERRSKSCINSVSLEEIPFVIANSDEESEVRNKRSVRGITLAPPKKTSYPIPPTKMNPSGSRVHFSGHTLRSLRVRNVESLLRTGSSAALDKSGEPTGTIIHRNSEITSSLASKLAAHYLEVPVRSPLSCSLPWGVCQLCYGWGLSEGRRVTLGEAVGIIAAQSIGEPGTQLTLRTFHTGGVFSGELLNEIRAPYNGNVMFPTPLQGLLIRTPHGQIAFLTKVSGKMKVYETEMHFESKRENLQLPTKMNPYPEGVKGSTKFSSAAFHDLPNVAERRSKVSDSVGKFQINLDQRSPEGTSVAELRLPQRGTQSQEAEEILRQQKKEEISPQHKEQIEKIHDIAELNSVDSEEVRSKLQQDSEFFIQPSTVIFVKQKEYVVNNQLLAEFSSSTLQSVNDQIEITQQVLSDIAGQIWFKELEYGNRKGPGSGSLGIYFSSQKLGGIWVLAGKPMIDTHSSFASPLREYKYPTCTANLLPQSNSFEIPQLDSIPPIKRNPIPPTKMNPYPIPLRGPGVKGSRGNKMKGYKESNAMLVPLEFHANGSYQTSVWMRSKSLFAGDQQLRGTPFLQIEDLRGTSKEFNDYKVKPLLSFDFAKELENENWSEAGSTINNFAKSKSDLLKSFIPLVTIVRGKQKLAQPTKMNPRPPRVHFSGGYRIKNNISSKIIREISRYNNLVLSKSPKTNNSFLKRKNLFKYRIYGIQNRLKRFISTRYTKTCKTSRIHNYGYSLQSSDVLKYDYVLGYSQTASFKKPPFPLREYKYHHNSKSLLFFANRYQTSVWMQSKSFARYRKNNKLITYGKEQRDLGNRAIDKSMLRNERIDNKIKKSIFIFQELRSQLQKSSESKFTSVAGLRTGQEKTRGSNNKLDMLPLLAESDLVTFVTNYNSGHNQTPPTKMNPTGSTQAKSNVGQMLFHPIGIKTNSLPGELSQFDKSYKSKSLYPSTKMNPSGYGVSCATIRRCATLCRSVASELICNCRSFQYPLPPTKMNPYPIPHTPSGSRGPGVKGSRGTQIEDLACVDPVGVRGVRSKENLDLSSALHTPSEYAKQNTQNTPKRICEAAEVKESLGGKNKKPMSIACKANSLHMEDLQTVPSFAIENIISLPSIPVLPPLAPYFNKTSFSLSTFLSTQQSKGSVANPFGFILVEESINNKSMNNFSNNRKVNKLYLSTILMNSWFRNRSSATLSLQPRVRRKPCTSKGYRTSAAFEKFFVSQGNKSFYFATEKRRLQSTWIQKKRAYLTFLNQVCLIPFTQQFSKNTKFNAKGYTAGAFTNFIGRTNVQLSTFSSIPPTKMKGYKKSNATNATLVPSSEYLTSYKYKSYKSNILYPSTKMNPSGYGGSCANSGAELSLPQRGTQSQESSWTMYKPITPFWRKGNNNLLTKNDELGRNQRSVRGGMLTNSFLANRRFSLRAGNFEKTSVAKLRTEELAQRLPLWGTRNSEGIVSTSCVKELCQRIVLRNCANEVAPVFPGQLVTYGDNITNNIVTTESGQILYIDSQKTTVRKAQTVLIYSQAIIAVLLGDWIKKGTPLMSLSYQKLVTGDIVQGLPKIEQFFEAPVLRDGTFWSDSLQAKLNQFFQEEREKLPLAQAVRKGFSEIQRVLVEGVLRVYISQGVLIADKHLEVIVRQMTCKGRILYSGDTGFLRNELVSLDKIENVNQVTYGQKALYHPQVRGITDASLESESFLSAASFQETTRVLSRDAIIGKTDLMRGLKERVIVGELIQAGTGLANNSVYNLLADCIA